MRKQILILLGFSFSLIACQQNEEIGSVEDNANPNELTTRAASMRRVPTQAEKDNLKKDFPNLDVNDEIDITYKIEGKYIIFNSNALYLGGAPWVIKSYTQKHITLIQNEASPDKEKVAIIELDRID